LNAAQEELRICADQNPDLLQMATTIVAALWMGSCVYILNVGDSRAYIVASKQITQLTKDHSYVQELIDSGMISPEQADDHIHKNIITRSVGTKEKVTPDLFKVSLSDLSSYCLLLCTDGLTNLVSDEEIQKILSGAGSLRGKTDKLIGLANDRGGFDNITVLLLSDHN
jgi:protein phosphatase